MPRASHKRQYSCGVCEGREDDFYDSLSRFACMSGSPKQSAEFYATWPSKSWPSVFYLNLWSRSPLACPMGSLEAIVLCGRLRSCRICWWGVYDAHQKFPAHAAELSTVIGPFVVLTTSHEELLSKLQLIRKHYWFILRPLIYGCPVNHCLLGLEVLALVTKQVQQSLRSRNIRRSLQPLSSLPAGLI